MPAVASAFSSAFSFAFSFVVSSAVLTAQEPVAQRPTGSVPVDSTPELTPADSARLDSLRERQRHTRCWCARPMPDCGMVFLADFGLVRGRGFTTLLGASPSRWIGANLRYEHMTVRGKRSGLICRFGSDPNATPVD